MIRKTLCVAALATVAFAATAQARDQIRIVGSSTVYPFATAVAEQFGKTSGFKTPVVESTGTGGGLKLFCAGADENSPDITNASRRIKQSEIDACAANGVKEISEIVIGYDGHRHRQAKAGKPLPLSREQIFKAIAKTVRWAASWSPIPTRSGAMSIRRCPRKTSWSSARPPTMAPANALVELVMDEACDKFPEIKALSGDAKKVACDAVREDGAFIEVSENYTVTLQKLSALPYSVGILSYSYLDQNGDKIQGSTVDGQAASYDKYRHRQISAVPSAVLLCEEEPCRRHSGHQGIYRPSSLRTKLGQGRLSGR